LNYLHAETVNSRHKTAPVVFSKFHLFQRNILTVFQEEDQKKATQTASRDILPIRQHATREKARPITAAEKSFKAYEHVRRARGAAKSIGRKEKKAKEREQELVPSAKSAKEPKEKKGKKGAADE
jgi:Ribosomal protein L13e